MPHRVALGLHKPASMKHVVEEAFAVLSFAALLAACNPTTPAQAALADEPDAGATSADAASAPSDAAPSIDAPASDAGASLPLGCASVLTPGMDPDLAIALRADGPWQRCGAYGSGPARVMRSSANGARAIVVTASGDAFVVTLPGLARIAGFAVGSGRIGYAALSPDGRVAATLDDISGLLAIWDVDAQTLTRVIRRAPAWPSYSNTSADLAFSSDGARLAVASAQHLEVYDVATGQARPISTRSDVGNGNKLAFVAGDTRLAVATYSWHGNGPYLTGGSVDVMDADTGDHRITLPVQVTVAVELMAGSRDGSTIAVSVEGRGLGIHFFDANTGAERPTPGIFGELLGLSADGTRVALIEGDWQNEVAVRRVDDGTLLASVIAPNFYPMGSQRGPIEVSPDLDLALFGDIPPHVLTTMALADGAEGGVACGEGHPNGVSGVTVTRDGTRLASAPSFNTDPVLVWDVASGARVDEPPSEDAESMDGTSADGLHVVVPRSDGYFDVREVTSDSLVAILGPHITRVLKADWSEDGRRIVSEAERDPVDRWGNPPSVKVWDFAASSLEQTIPGEDHLPALFAPGGRRLFVAGDGSVAAWCR